MFLRHSYKKYEVGRDIYYFLRKPWWVEERDVTGMRGAPSGCGWHSKGTAAAAALTGTQGADPSTHPFSLRGLQR